MNVERLLQLADVLETKLAEDHFDMSQLFLARGSNQHLPAAEAIEKCGSAACIAGWVVVLFAPKTVLDGCGVGILDAGQELLELTAKQADRLFFPRTGRAWDKAERTSWGAKPAEAAKVVRHFAATGRVEWDRALKP